MKHSPGFLKLVDDAMKRVKTIAIPEVARKLEAKESFHFIDVREDDEWRQEHCRGARHLGRGVLERDIETEIPDKNAPIVLYCGGGFRSALAADNIQKMGYTNVLSMEGGFRGWKESGAPTSR